MFRDVEPLNWARICDRPEFFAPAARMIFLGVTCTTPLHVERPVRRTDTA
jgi:hypothetical protein